MKRLHTTTHPLLYEVNTRVLINELSARHGEPVTLGTIPEAVIDEWASLGFDAIWLMGVWTTGKTGLEIARQYPALQGEYAKALPDVSRDDIIGSPYAVKAYTVSSSLGGRASLLALRKRLEKRGLGLVLDFVVNHTARDHVWVKDHPEYYINGNPGEEVQRPEYYFKTKTKNGDRIIAFGRDPYFPGWTDTAQLNHRHPRVREALSDAAETIAGLCDGVRCDMAMLVLQQVFDRTWGERAQPADASPAMGEFWTEVMSVVKSKYPKFLFIAEVYWNLEWQMQQLGFDYTYDKVFYDRLLKEGAAAVYEHFKAEIAFQRRSVRFIENHDELRSAQALSSEAWLYAAATVAATLPGMGLFHEGQLDGRKIKIPVQLGRRPQESPSPRIRAFYEKLFSCLRAEVFRQGEWRLLGIKPAWKENYTWSNFLAYWWHDRSGSTRLVVVNYAPLNGQCYVELDLNVLEGSPLEFRDLMSDAVYVRERAGLVSKGMYFDLPGYGFHLFDLSSVRKNSR